MNLLLETRIAPDWDAIDEKRQEILELLEAAGLSSPKAYAISMVARELLENAIKYGDFTGGKEVGLQLTRHHDRLTLQVSNPTGEQQAPHLEKLDRILQRIRGFQDPHQAYLTRLDEVAHLSLDDTEGGLGLVRAAYEGDAALDFHLGEGGSLAVVAIFDG